MYYNTIVLHVVLAALASAKYISAWHVFLLAIGVAFTNIGWMLQRDVARQAEQAARQELNAANDENAKLQEMLSLGDSVSAMELVLSKKHAKEKADWGRKLNKTKEDNSTLSAALAEAQSHGMSQLRYVVWVDSCRFDCAAYLTVEKLKSIAAKASAQRAAVGKSRQQQPQDSSNKHVSFAAAAGNSILRDKAATAARTAATAAVFGEAAGRQQQMATTPAVAAQPLLPHKKLNSAMHLANIQGSIRGGRKRQQLVSNGVSSTGTQTVAQAEPVLKLLSKSIENTQFATRILDDIVCTYNADTARLYILVHLRGTLFDIHIFDIHI